MKLPTENTDTEESRLPVDEIIRDALFGGLVIPAHPLVLTEERKLDERRQVGLTRYYCDAGAGGIAVGVHTTQFAIRDPEIGLFAPVLQLAIETMRSFEKEHDKRLVKVAGVCSNAQALRGGICFECGYDSRLLSLAAREASHSELIQHCRRWLDLAGWAFICSLQLADEF